MQFWYKKFLSFYFLLQVARIRQKKRFLLCWNRGLGDIPLGLYGLCRQIRKVIPDATICFLTRNDLAKAFELLPKVEVFVDHQWRRGSPIDIYYSLQQLGIKREDFDVLMERPDPTRWLIRDIGRVIPKLTWKKEWDFLTHSYSLPAECIGIHVNTETGAYYSYEKNWPVSHWKGLLESLTKNGKNVLLFGLKSHAQLAHPSCIDLCGKTTLFEALSLIKNCCSVFIAPDSGLLSLMYYLNADFPLKVISLWADPKQGILRQKVASPNRFLQHIPLIAPCGNLKNLAVSRVEEVLFL